MLLVMSTAGIFDEEECALTVHTQTDSRRTHSRSDSEVHKYSALWQVTWERIDCFLPNLRQELFTPRSQSPAVNTPQVKAEQEKVITEESNPVPDLPGPVDEGTILISVEMVGLVIKELKQTTTVTATRTSPNKRFNEQKDSSTRAFDILVHFLAVFCETNNMK